MKDEDLQRHAALVFKYWATFEGALRCAAGLPEKTKAQESLSLLQKEERIPRAVLNILHRVKNERNELYHEERIPLPDPERWERECKYGIGFLQELSQSQPTLPPVTPDYLRLQSLAAKLETPSNTVKSDRAETTQSNDTLLAQWAAKFLAGCFVFYLAAQVLTWILEGVEMLLRQFDNLVTRLLIPLLTRGNRLLEDIDQVLSRQFHKYYHVLC